MSHGNDPRLTDHEHGTLNAALTWYADEIEDPFEAQGVRELAKTIISREVLIRPAATAPGNSWPTADQLYTYQVQWSSEAYEHVGTVAEFPSLSWLDADPCVALDGIRNLVAEALKDIAQTGKEPPAPGVR